jgi:thioredoxin 1
MKEMKIEEFKSTVYDFEKSKKINKNLTVIDFYADWCQPCKVMEKSLNDIKNEFKDVDFIKINAEEEYELTEFFQIRNLPTLIFIDFDGNIYSESGLIPKGLLSKKINEYKSEKEIIS